MPYKRFNTFTPDLPSRTFACPECGGQNVHTELIDHRFSYGNGDSAVGLVARVPLRKCRDCQAEYLDSEAEDLMHEAVCRHLGVMTPAEVRSVRQQCGGLPRTEFARITGLGEATIGRWERGELIQNTANDQLLYLLTFPENVIRLRARARRTSDANRSGGSSAGPQPQFRVLAVTAELTEQAQSFVFATTGAV